MVDRLQVAKRFEIRLNLTEEQSAKAILKLSSLKQKGGNSYRASVNGTQFFVQFYQRYSQQEATGFIKGKLQGEPNLKITYVKGSVYGKSDFKLLSIGIGGLLLTPLALLGGIWLGHVEGILYSCLIPVWIGTLAFGLSDTVRKREVTWRDFKEQFKRIDSNHSLLDDEPNPPKLKLKNKSHQRRF
jgi:hypothetical protein